MSSAIDENETNALAEAVGRYVFQIELPSFNAYLETISKFLKTETKKHRKEISKLKDEDWQYEEHLNSLLGEINGFENILLKSSFTAIYGFLEAKLIQFCRIFEKDNQTIMLPLSDIDDKGVEKAKEFYKQNMNFSFGKCEEWPRIKIYGIIRNCIAHNEGRFDDGFIIKESLRKELKKFINQKNSNLCLDGHDIVLTKEFCKSAWKTIKEFLWLVSQAETQAKE